jgi:hypothetical protein
MTAFKGIFLLEANHVKPSTLFRSSTRVFVHVGLAAGLITACENGQNSKMRSAPTPNEAVSASNEVNESTPLVKNDSSDNEQFSFDLHGSKVSERVSALTRRKPPNGDCRLPEADTKPAMPVVSPDTQAPTVGHMNGIFFLVCTRTPEQFKGLWTFGKSMTPEQITNAKLADATLGAQLEFLNKMSNLITLEGILLFRGIICPEPVASGSVNPTPGPNNAVGTSTATIKISGKDSANLP